MTVLYLQDLGYLHLHGSTGAQFFPYLIPRANDNVNAVFKWVYDFLE